MITEVNTHTKRYRAKKKSGVCFSGLFTFFTFYVSCYAPVHISWHSLPLSFFSFVREVFYFSSCNDASSYCDIPDKSPRNSFGTLKIRKREKELRFVFLSSYF